MTAKTRIFQLKIQLREVRPPVWRRVLVPGEVTLAELHEVLQVAMGWTDSHLHEFEVDGARYGMPDPNWDPDADWDLDEVTNESQVTLCQVAGEGSRLRYAYDFGDDWQHDVTVEKVLSPQPAARNPLSVLPGGPACLPTGGCWRTVGIPGLPGRSQRPGPRRARAVRGVGRRGG